jgi:hypothetical protein
MTANVQYLRHLFAVHQCTENLERVVIVEYVKLVWLATCVKSEQSEVYSSNGKISLGCFEFGCRSMKIVGNIEVCNRLLPSLNIPDSRRSQWSSLTIGKCPGSNAELFILYQSAQNKLGTKYKVITKGLKRKGII